MKFIKNRYGETRTNEDVFVVNSTYARHNIKKRVLQQKLIPCICQSCGIGETWNNKKLVLQLDHINGINNDNRIENLRFLCPNCHSQQETFSARNIKKKNASVVELVDTSVLEADA